MKSELQQVSTGLQDSAKYSSRVFSSTITTIYLSIWDRSNLSIYLSIYLVYAYLSIYQNLFLPSFLPVSSYLFYFTLFVSIYLASLLAKSDSFSLYIYMYTYIHVCMLPVTNFLINLLSFRGNKVCCVFDPNFLATIRYPLQS